MLVHHYPLQFNEWCGYGLLPFFLDFEQLYSWNSAFVWSDHYSKLISEKYHRSSLWNFPESSLRNTRSWIETGTSLWRNICSYTTCSIKMLRTGQTPLLQIVNPIMISYKPKVIVSQFGLKITLLRYNCFENICFHICSVWYVPKHY